MTETQPPRGIFPSPGAKDEDRPEASSQVRPTEVRSNESDADIGERIGPYRILERLGSGGMGIVYKCEEELLRRAVAVKVIRAKYAGDEHYRRRFHREARAVAALSHPSLVHIYGFGEFERAGISRLYLAMEYVDGPSVEGLLERRGKLSPEEAVRFTRDAALGLREAFRHGILHRDVKPSNLLVAPSGPVKVVDFGLAKELRSEGPQTEDGVVLGTPHYISPEQGRGKPVDHRSDMYSLGATLYHMIAGRPPFEGESHVAVIVAHVNEEPPPLEAVPEPLAAVVSKMLAKEPLDRYPDYDALLEDLEALRAGREPARAMAALRSKSQRAPLAPPRRRLAVRRLFRLGRSVKRRLAIAAALALLAVGGAGAWTAARVTSSREASSHRLAAELGSWHENLGDGRDLIRAEFSRTPPGPEALTRLFVIPQADSEDQLAPHLGFPRASWKLGDPKGAAVPRMLVWESYTRPFACRVGFQRIDEVRLAVGPIRNLFDLGLEIVDPGGWKRRSLVFRLRPWDRTPRPLLALRSQEPVALEPIGAGSPSRAGGEDSVPRVGTDPFEIGLAFRVEAGNTLVTVRIVRRARSEPLYEAGFRLEGTDWPSGALLLQTPSPTKPFLVTLEKLSICGVVERSAFLEEFPWPD